MAIIEQFDGHFESLASTATNINVILERLTTATMTQYTKTTKLLDEITANSANTNSAAVATGTPSNTTTHPPAHPCEEKYKPNNRITQIKTEVQKKWIPGSFCSTHGHGVSYGHISGT